MDATLSTRWICDELAPHFSGEEWNRIQTYLHAESWASPSSRKWWFEDPPLEIPLRFHLDIDMQS
ncbi:hypothetical protein C8P63_11092 [Melghirimyces profundicolus]|uniref:Uncharacterized protein n=1 Tax=Melghirimyces profundicolus TaxID=1242148 RepID=A0A2T6BVD9_9BACL|nr:hypothetical protein [Melghirimyces profundicolus]PTX59947.1 hypothetical protein C8P63_11092 [Melghirimyces profundicolus]